MSDCDPMCAVVFALFREHAWGTPISRDDLVKRAAVEHDGDAKDAIDELRSAEYRFAIVSNSRVKIDNSHLYELFDFLVLRCGRDPELLQLRDSHYEGWHRHEWWPPKE